MGGSHSHLLDNHAHLDSPLRRLPAGLKVLVAVGLVLAIVSVKGSLFFFALIALLLIGLIFISRVPMAFILKRLMMLEPFVIGVALLSLIQPHGLHVFAALVARSTLCLLIMLLLSNTTPFSDLLAVLRKTRMPGLMVTTIALMHRYLYVLLDESDRMRRARSCRTFDRRAARTWSNLASVIGQLFARSTERAERIYTSMCARGWKT